MNRDVFKYLPDDPAVTFEQGPMKKLVAANQLAAYKHPGVWYPADTFAEYSYLNQLWDLGQARWKV